MTTESRDARRLIESIFANRGWTNDELTAAVDKFAAAAATRMRDACAAKVKARRDRFQAAADASSLPNDLTASRDAAVAAAFTRLLGEIESLTLDHAAADSTQKDNEHHG